MTAPLRRTATDGCMVGVSDHYGWAVLVTAAADGSLLDRRRVELVDPGLTKHPYHHEAQALPLDEAVALVKRVRMSARRNALRALDTVARAVPVPIRGIAIRRCPTLPPTIAGRISDYRAQCVADTVMYRQALARAAAARDWMVHWYDARKVLGEAAHVLQVDSIDRYFSEVRRSVGPPWGGDHKVAMAAAMVAAGGYPPARR